MKKKTGTAADSAALVEEASLAARPKKLGRRSFSDLGDTENRDVILNAAEKVFAQNGYLGTSFRQIAEEADVTQALITYYFETKQNLHKSIFKRRLAEISEVRLASLDKLDPNASQTSLASFIRAYIEPQFLRRHGSAEWLNFARLQARLTSEPQEIAAPLRQEVYDSTIKVFLERMREFDRSLDDGTAAWGAYFLIGIMLYTLRGDDRISELSDGRIHFESDEDVVDKITTFVMGGIDALKDRNREGS